MGLPSRGLATPPDVTTTMIYRRVLRVGGGAVFFTQAAPGADRRAVSARTHCTVDTRRPAVRAIFTTHMPVRRKPLMLILPGVRADD